MGKKPEMQKSGGRPTIPWDYSDDSSIEPDSVSAPVEGYYRLPPIWLGEQPPLSQVATLNPKIHHAVVLERTLQCGAAVRVQRDGLFLFDFTKWDPGGITNIPGFQRPPPGTPIHRPAEHQRAIAAAIRKSVLRAQVLNAHQAFLTTSQRAAGSGYPLGYPVESQQTYQTLKLDDPIQYDGSPERPRSLGQMVANGVGNSGLPASSQRPVFAYDVAERSLEMLDSLLCRRNESLIQLIEAAYLSGFRQVEGRLSESIAIGWMCCEQLLSTIWNNILENKQEIHQSIVRMNKQRRKKLDGRDYTASVRIEFLAMVGLISEDLYTNLERARKARNDWAHNMQQPTEDDVKRCEEATRSLLDQVHGIDFRLHTPERQLSRRFWRGPWERSKAAGQGDASS